jgi:hypothetical protein
VIGSRFLDVLLDRTHPSLAPILLGTSVTGELNGGIGLHPTKQRDGAEEWVSFRTAGDPTSLDRQVDAQVHPVWNRITHQILHQPGDPV